MLGKIFKILISPKKEWSAVLEGSESGFYIFKKYALTFALIGPVLSFYSLYFTENFSFLNAIIYSITTYVLDLLVVVIFAFIFSKISKNFYFVNFDKSLKFITIVYIVIWLSDIVDIYQPLRILSNVGLIYSFYLLYTGIIHLEKKIEKSKVNKLFIISSFIHLGLYILDAAISEMIAMNPLLKEMLSSF